ncbi:MAG: ATP-binding cassette domain-containing protein, partial [Gammaproteobacteria bacterium]
MSAILQTVDIHAGYGEAAVLHGVDLVASAGRVTAVVGSNGAGKTSLMRVLAGVLPATAGRMTYEGGELTRTESHERVARGIVLVPEGRL